MNIFLVIDLQKQFKDDNGMYDKCLDFLNKTSDKYVIGTVFRNEKGSQFERHVNWSACMDTSLADLEYEYNNAFVKKSKYIDYEELKTCIGCAIEMTEEKVNIYLIGCDSDACVMATAFALWDMDLDFKIVTDLIYTTAEDIDNKVVLQMMRRNFGDCLIRSDKI